MTSNEFDAVIEFQRGEIRELENLLGLLKAFHEETQRLFKAEQQINQRLQYSMEVFDPASKWNMPEGDPN